MYSNSYKYIDPDQTYTDPITGILKNLQGIKDPDVLLFVESSAVTKRLQQLYDNPIEIKDSNSLLVIHHYLFQDVYAWAGKVRTVNIYKDGKPFFNGERFSMGFQYIDTLINDYRNIEKLNKEALASKLSEILDNINFFAPI
jgi:cell filamentation protein